MLYSLLKSSSIPCVPIHDHYQKLVFKQVEKDGKIVRVSVFEDADLNNKIGMYDVNDFSLSHILSVGAYDMLKPCFNASMSNLCAADMVEKSIKSFSHAEEKK